MGVVMGPIALGANEIGPVPAWLDARIADIDTGFPPGIRGSAGRLHAAPVARERSDADRQGCPGASAGAGASQSVFVPVADYRPGIPVQNLGRH
jgi:hypothetical protein